MPEWISLAVQLATLATATFAACVSWLNYRGQNGRYGLAPDVSLVPLTGQEGWFVATFTIANTDQRTWTTLEYTAKTPTLYPQYAMHTHNAFGELVPKPNFGADPGAKLIKNVQAIRPGETHRFSLLIHAPTAVSPSPIQLKARCIGLDRKTAVTAKIVVMVERPIETP